MKLRSVLYAIAAVLLAASCIPKEEKQEIVVPEESKAVFTSGLSFDASEEEQTKTVTFTATDRWSITITGNNSNPLSWLSVQPFGGSAGPVTMTVTAQPNTETTPRSATITLTCGTDNKSFTITQAAAVPKVIPVSSVTLDKTSLMLERGSTATLVATITPENATDQTITWSSSDAAVATVDQNGKVTAVEAGLATITAKAGEKTATCAVTVFNYVFGISPINVEISGDGGTFTITVVASMDYQISAIPDWISQVSVEDKVHTFKAERNPGDEERTGVITFTDAKGTNESCTVKQGRHIPDSADGNIEIIEVDDDIDW